MTDPKTYVRIVVETKPDNLMDGRDMVIRRSGLSVFIDLKDGGDRKNNIVRGAQAVKNLTNINYESL